MNDLKIIIGFKTYKIEDDLYTSLQKKRWIFIFFNFCYSSFCLLKMSCLTKINFSDYKIKEAVIGMMKSLYISCLGNLFALLSM